MMGGQWEKQSRDSSFQEVKSVSPRSAWGRSTWELQLPAACFHKASKTVTFYSQNVRGAQGGQKKDILSIISCTVQRTSSSQQALKLEVMYRKARGWLNVKESLAQRKKFDVAMR